MTSTSTLAPAADRGDAPARAPGEIPPTVIFGELRSGVLGQDRRLRFVSVAIFKHTTGKVSGNILLVGSSGTGKTTIMNNIQRLYDEVPEYRPFRALTIINANLLVDATGWSSAPTASSARSSSGRARCSASVRRRARSQRRWNGRRCTSTRSTRCRRWWPASRTPWGDPPAGAADADGGGAGRLPDPRLGRRQGARVHPRYPHQHG